MYACMLSTESRTWTIAFRVKWVFHTVLIKWICAIQPRNEIQIQIYHVPMKFASELFHEGQCSCAMKNMNFEFKYFYLLDVMYK